MVCAGLIAVRYVTEPPISIRGAVVTSNRDPAKELPVSDVVVTVLGGPPTAAVRSDAVGFFNIQLTERLRRGLRVTLQFRHPDYQPLDLLNATGKELYVAHLVPLVQPKPAPAHGPQISISSSSVVVQYSLNTMTTANVGSAVRTFRVVNNGDVPCQARQPCSPDGRWKAAMASTTLDAGPGNEFENARASCIAGPCPFTRIEGTNVSSNGRMLKVSALDWSDTATFLVEAEVVKPVINDVGRRLYPLIFEDALTFTLPADAEGVSMEAQVNGMNIVFPLGPALFLPWARCQVVINNDKTKVYRCELKSGYRFS